MTEYAWENLWLCFYIFYMPVSTVNRKSTLGLAKQYKATLSTENKNAFPNTQMK